MRLFAYRRTADAAVVDAVFSSPHGILHVQRVNASATGGSKIHYAFPDGMPDFGKVAEGYDVIVSAGTGSDARLGLESQWHELIARALLLPHGFEAMVRFFADAYERFRPEVRSGGSGEAAGP